MARCRPLQENISTASRWHFHHLPHLPGTSPSSGSHALRPRGVPGLPTVPAISPMPYVSWTRLFSQQWTFHGLRAQNLLSCCWWVEAPWDESCKLDGCGPVILGSSVVWTYAYRKLHALSCQAPTMKIVNWRLWNCLIPYRTTNVLLIWFWNLTFVVMCVSHQKIGRGIGREKPTFHMTAIKLPMQLEGHWSLRVNLTLLSRGLSWWIHKFVAQQWHSQQWFEGHRHTSRGRKMWCCILHSSTPAWCFPNCQVACKHANGKDCFLMCMSFIKPWA